MMAVAQKLLLKGTGTMHIKTYAGIFAAAMLAMATNIQATTYDFTNPGTSSTQIGSGFGNALDFGDLTVTAWGTTGAPVGANNSLLNSGQILRFNTGLGACNRSEGTNCNNPVHQVDNVGDDDLVMFLFDNLVDFDNIVIDPFGTYDRDVSFWIADITPVTDLTGVDPFTLINGTSIFGNVTNVGNFPGSGPLTINLGGATGNALLFGGKLDAGNNYDNDRFKIASLTATAVIPVPAAVWLFGSGLLGLVSVARRKQH